MAVAGCVMIVCWSEYHLLGVEGGRFESVSELKVWKKRLVSKQNVL